MVEPAFSGVFSEATMASRRRSHALYWASSCLGGCLAIQLLPGSGALYVICLLGSLIPLAVHLKTNHAIRTSTPFVMFAVASVMGGLTSGNAQLALADASKDILWLLILLASTFVGASNSNKALKRVVDIALLAGMANFLVTLSQLGSYRPSGVFENPNMSGSFASWILVISICGTGSRTFRRSVLHACLFLTVLLSGSFGSVLTLAVAAMTMAYFRNRPRFVRWMSLAAIFTACLIPVLSVTPVGGGANETVLARLARSIGERLLLFQDAFRIFLSHPFGVGGGVIGGPRYNANEIHSDALSALAERGLLGLFAFCWIVRTLYRRSKNLPLGHVCFNSFLSGIFVRQTLHFRHIAIVLGLALGLSLAARSAALSEARDKRISSKWHGR